MESLKDHIFYTVYTMLVVLHGVTGLPAQWHRKQARLAHNVNKWIVTGLLVSLVQTVITVLNTVFTLRISLATGITPLLQVI